MRFTSLVARNIKILIRSKITVLIILLAPLLAVLLAAIAFDNENQYSLKIATYGEDYPRIANQFLDELEKSSFQIERLKSETACREAVRDGKVHACMLFTADSRKQVLITMLVDFSKVQVVDHLLSQVSDKVSLKSSEISLNMTESLLKRVDSTREEVEKNRYVITSLTTGQESVGRQLDELNAKLAAFDPKIDLAGANKLIATIDNTSTIGKMDSFTRLKDDLVYQLGQVSKEIEAELSNDAITEDDKNKLRLIISQNDMKVRKISDEFRATAAITDQDLAGLKSELTATAANLKALQSQVDNLKDTKFQANVQMRALKSTIDDNLVKIIILQNALNKIGASIETVKISSDTLHNPIRTEIEPIVATDSRLNMIFPTMLAFLMMVTCALLSASLTVFHRKNPGSLRDNLLPIDPLVRVFALFTTVLLVVAAQAAVIFILAAYLMGPAILLGLPGAALASLALMAVFVVLGMILGFACATEQGALLSSMAIACAALVFSDILLPIETMPDIVAGFAKLNPFVLGSSLISRALIYQAPISTLIGGISMLLIYALALCVILLVQKRENF